jgi:hypothetical protein
VLYDTKGMEKKTVVGVLTHGLSGVLFCCCIEDALVGNTGVYIGGQKVLPP